MNSKNRANILGFVLLILLVLVMSGCKAGSDTQDLINEFAKSSVDLRSFAFVMPQLAEKLNQLSCVFAPAVVLCILLMAINAVSDAFAGRRPSPLSMKNRPLTAMLFIIGLVLFVVPMLDSVGRSLWEIMGLDINLVRKSLGFVIPLIEEGAKLDDIAKGEIKIPDIGPMFAANLSAMGILFIVNQLWEIVLIMTLPYDIFKAIWSQDLDHVKGWFGNVASWLSIGFFWWLGLQFVQPVGKGLWSLLNIGSFVFMGVTYLAWIIPLGSVLMGMGYRLWSKVADVETPPGLQTHHHLSLEGIIGLAVALGAMWKYGGHPAPGTIIPPSLQLKGPAVEGEVVPPPAGPPPRTPRRKGPGTPGDVVDGEFFRTPRVPDPDEVIVPPPPEEPSQKGELAEEEPQASQEDDAQTSPEGDVPTGTESEGDAWTELDWGKDEQKPDLVPPPASSRIDEPESDGISNGGTEWLPFPVPCDPKLDGYFAAQDIYDGEGQIMVRKGGRLQMFDLELKDDGAYLYGQKLNSDQYEVRNPDEQGGES